jgi:SAM-dependent methyltransferase
MVFFANWRAPCFLPLLKNTPGKRTPTNSTMQKEEDDNNWDWEGTSETMAELEESDKTVPLFFTKEQCVCNTPVLALQYTVDHTGFDLTRYCLDRKLDTYQRLRAVNFIRAATSDTQEDALKELNSASPACLNNDLYLQPAFPNDPMLRHAMALAGAVEEDAWSDDEEETGTYNGGIDAKTAPPPAACTTTASSLATPPTSTATTGTTAARSHAPSAREVQLAKRLTRATELLKAYGVQDEMEEGLDNDTYYFDSYSHWGIHQEMLADRVRTEAYQHAIEKNRKYFEGKTVLDIGCGTGILSMFAARAGAKLVVGIDMSEMAFKAMDNVKENGLQDVITIVHGKVEDLGDRGESVDEKRPNHSDGSADKLKLLQPGSFDVILSEWMGYALVFECMLETVLKARDVWLKPNGLVLPNIAEVYVQGMGDVEEWNKTIGYWKDVYGFKMNTMTALVLPEAHVFVVNKDSVCGARYLLHTYDICSVKPEDLDIVSRPFTLTLKPTDTTLTGLCISFDCDFAAENVLEHSVKLPTGPECTPTHWKQTVLYLPEPIVLDSQGETEHRVEGTLTIARNSQNPRHLDFVLTIGTNTYQYKMG